MGVHNWTIDPLPRGSRAAPVRWPHRCDQHDPARGLSVQERPAVERRPQPSSVDWASPEAPSLFCLCFACRALGRSAHSRRLSQKSGPGTASTRLIGRACATTGRRSSPVVTSGSNRHGPEPGAWTDHHKLTGRRRVQQALVQVETECRIMTHRVVAGFDGSAAALAAVTWAAGEARLRSAELVASTVLDRHGSRHVADSVAAKTPPRSLEESAGGYPVTVRHGYGDAAAELVAACWDADLLVVGSRGHGPLKGLVLGSVSRACLAHAPCPVVVVRPQPEEATPRGRVIVGVDGSDHSRQACLLYTSPSPRDRS